MEQLSTQIFSAATALARNWGYKKQNVKKKFYIIYKIYFQQRYSQSHYNVKTFMCVFVKVHSINLYGTWHFFNHSKEVRAYTHIILLVFR